MIQPNIQKIYLCPSFYVDHFIFDGRRYYLTPDKALVSDYGEYGMLPPEGRGFYILISKKEFKEAKANYKIEQQKFINASKGYLNIGGYTQPTLF